MTYPRVPTDEELDRMTQVQLSRLKTSNLQEIVLIRTKLSAVPTDHQTSEQVSWYNRAEAALKHKSRLDQKLTRRLAGKQPPQTATTSLESYFVHVARRVLDEETYLMIRNEAWELMTHVVNSKLAQRKT